MSDISVGLSREELLADFRLARLSREIALLARREVLSGKAKFGIFGDGKELAQIALARNFREGDWRSGYYRDHTFMMATGITNAEQFFYQVYGHTDETANPGSAGRNFNNHFASRSINEDGSWNRLSEMKNSCADLSPTAGQMPRLVGLAYASKLFRMNPELAGMTRFSKGGNEVAFGTIGDAATAEGHFFEAMNAAAVLQIPVAMAVWDDGYGISVTRDKQIVKSSVSRALEGFRKEEGSNGILIYRVRGWDYPEMIRLFAEGVARCREEQIPVLFHVDEMVQPMGHSTSGSHERYKSGERLEWEAAHDPLLKMEQWMLESGLAPAEELKQIKEEAVKEAREARDTAWKNYMEPIAGEREELLDIIGNRTCDCSREGVDKLGILSRDLKRIVYPVRRDIQGTAKRIMRHLCTDCPVRQELQDSISTWLESYQEENRKRYSSHLYSETDRSPLKVKPVKPEYDKDPERITGREILRDNFDALLASDPRIVIFGEDAGKIGDVNKSLEGLQLKYGEWRVTDTGLRETTIVGQGVGLALRGLRPIAEIQYFDYILFALETISDDLATLHWRTKGAQIAPLIIRTRGHRLEGIWHSGSPLSMVINSIRGVYVCVPRNMTQAAGMYNTLLQGDDPALVIEPLKVYGLREDRPRNMGAFRVPLGVPERIREGSDITVVSYGACVRIAEKAAEQLAEFDIHMELIDVQTLLPFDLDHRIVESVKKTGRILFFDEDVPGGATAYMLQKVLEEQKAYYHLDALPATVTAREHRPAYSSDGDYFSNPNAEDLFEAVYGIMHESNPEKFRAIY
ncbi:MAG: thiamine pyrophosphate-dependent enzyme [Bacteroidales bacterium]|nr:thiamine pyrophosphate-dependent enzyme [Bacteroidales bacterium]